MSLSKRYCTHNSVGEVDQERRGGEYTTRRPVTFWAQKAVLCFPGLHSRSKFYDFENDKMKLSVTNEN